MTWIAAAASVIGVLFIFWPARHLTAYQGAVVAVLTGVFVLAAALDIRDRWKRQPRRYKNERDINDYMFRWISRGGRVVIFTRDHTWAHEPRIRELLTTKARRDELTICLPVETELARDLARVGAEILAYPELNYTPASRFTIINDGRNDGAVAIGRQIEGVHTIQEFPTGDPVFAVTRDLVEILRRRP